MQQKLLRFQRFFFIWGVHTFGKGGSQGGSRKGGFTGGFTKRGVHRGVHEKGVHRGVHEKGVHVNPVNPPGYGPVSPGIDIR